MNAQRGTKWDQNQGPEARKSTPEAPKATREAPKATLEVPEAIPGALGRSSGAVLGDFGLQKSSPEGPRSDEKRTEKMLENWTFFGIVFAAVFDYFWDPKRRKNHLKTEKIVFILGENLIMNLTRSIFC